MGPSADCIMEASSHQHYIIFGGMLTYSDTIWTFTVNYREILAFRGRERGSIMPVFLFNADSNPFVLVVEIFLALIGPYPALLLNITSSPFISRNTMKGMREK